MGNFRCVLVYLVVLQVVIKSTTGVLVRDDVEKCIAGTKAILLRQQNLTQGAFDEVRDKQFDDARKLQDKKYDSLNTTIMKERGVLLTFRQSAVDDKYDVSACNDSSAIYKLIGNSFNASAQEITAEFYGLINRNYTRFQTSLNQLAQTYVDLEQKLKNCGDTETTCFEKLQNECTDVHVQDAMEDLETKYSGVCELSFFNVFSPQIENLYKLKIKDVGDHTQQMKACYRITKSSNGTDAKTNGGTSIRFLNLLMIFSMLFIVFAHI
ncbi:hypothetical protein WA026_013286 [Henosepilachna vigintioctopunctata]|uniref:Secreted protein n=1 Tax=Henosepilachna vigintioctopunctata TaxID=420089 RepID=A0AAW1VFB3_9CUCU